MQPLWDSVRGCWWDGQVTAVEGPVSSRLSCLLYTAFPGSPQGGGRGTRPGEKDGHGTRSPAAAPQLWTSCRTGKAPGLAQGAMWWVGLSTRGFASNKIRKTGARTTGPMGVALVSDLPNSTAAIWVGLGGRRAAGSTLWVPSTRSFLLENSSATGPCSPPTHLSSGPATQTRSHRGPWPASQPPTAVRSQLCPFGLGHPKKKTLPDPEGE